MERNLELGLGSHQKKVRKKVQAWNCGALFSQAVVAIATIQHKPLYAPDCFLRALNLKQIRSRFSRKRVFDMTKTLTSPKLKAV